MNTNSNGKKYPSLLRFDENTPLEEIEKVIPQNELDILDAIGDQRDDTRWQAGDMARLWIDERHLPTEQCLAIIARRTDWGKESIKKYLACSRFYYERKEWRDKYLVLRHSIFDHARQCSDPLAVLQAAFEKQLKPQVVKNNFPLLFDELKDTYNRVSKDNQLLARALIQDTIARLKELGR